MKTSGRNGGEYGIEEFCTNIINFLWELHLPFPALGSDYGSIPSQGVQATLPFLLRSSIHHIWPWPPFLCIYDHLDPLLHSASSSC